MLPHCTVTWKCENMHMYFCDDSVSIVCGEFKMLTTSVSGSVAVHLRSTNNSQIGNRMTLANEATTKQTTSA